MRRHVAIHREYERGWGSKDILAKEYPTRADAEAAVARANAKNTAPVAPDYYIQARYVAEVADEIFDGINRP
jgi:hypothetical protein